MGLTGELVVLVFIALLAQQPSLTAGRNAGLALTVLWLIAGSVAPFGKEVDDEFADRILQISAAVVYTVGAFACLEWIVTLRGVSEGPEHGRDLRVEHEKS